MRPMNQIVTRWWWLWLIHGFFIYVMYEFFFFRLEPWRVDTYRALGLSLEMNYAVWWSGICLYIAALVYFRIAQLYPVNRNSWNILGLVSVALCCDEIGSLHETVADLGGWLGLLPFAIILGGGFLWSIFNLAKDRATRLPALLIFTGVAIFACVAGLEFIEHNVEFTRSAQRWRLIVEEGSELVAMGIMITAGLIAYVRNGYSMHQSNDISLSGIAAVLRTGFLNPHYMYVAFVIQLTVVALLVIPNFSLFPFGTGEGNPAALYPVLLFFSLGLLCLNYAKNEWADMKTTFRILGSSLIAASVIQMFNVNRFINGMLQNDWDKLREPPVSWLMTLVPWLVVVWITRPEGKSGWLRTGGHLGILLLAVAVLSPGTRNLQLVDCYYFLFSSCVAYSCYYYLHDFVRRAG